MKIEFRPIGIIHSPYPDPAGVPIQGFLAKNVRGSVEVFPEFGEALADLDGFSHIILIYHFHRSSGFAQKCRPFLDTRERGVFATRAPRRPNPIGISIVGLLGMDACRLAVDSLDIVDGTPLLDIKPYVPDFDIRDAVRAGWYATAANKGQTVADSRFVTAESGKGR